GRTHRRPAAARIRRRPPACPHASANAGHPCAGRPRSVRRPCEALCRRRRPRHALLGGRARPSPHSRRQGRGRARDRLRCRTPRTVAAALT
ncbi:hypothetical protein, partial [Mesorhizobium sp.]|uniref:hypothetical protein n=1 Tax=Mesorhizobium sp. TaxID=1871066 RepID=UPI0034443415